MGQVEIAPSADCNNFLRLNVVFFISSNIRVSHPGIETLLPTGKFQVHGLKITSNREQLRALFCTTGDGRFVSDGAPPWFASVFGLGRDGCDCFFEPILFELEPKAQVAYADKECVDSVDQGNLSSARHGIRRFDLSHYKRLSSGVLDVAFDSNASHFKVGIERSEIQSSVTNGWKLYHANDSPGFHSRGNVRKHESRGAVFEKPAKARLFARRRPQHAIDIVQMKTCEQRLDFCDGERAMFQVEPDTIESNGSRDLCIRREVVAQRTNLYDLAVAKLLKCLALSHRKVAGPLATRSRE